MIIIKKHWEGYKAYMAGHPATWEYGSSKAEAVYKLMVTLGKVVEA